MYKIDYQVDENIKLGNASIYELGIAVLSEANNICAKGEGSLFFTNLFNELSSYFEMIERLLGLIKQHYNNTYAKIFTSGPTYYNDEYPFNVSLRSAKIQNLVTTLVKRFNKNISSLRSNNIILNDFINEIYDIRKVLDDNFARDFSMTIKNVAIKSKQQHNNNTIIMVRPTRPNVIFIEKTKKVKEIKADDEIKDEIKDEKRESLSEEKSN